VKEGGGHREEQETRSPEREKKGRHREERAMLSMSLDLEGQRGHRMEQDTSPLEHEKEEQREEPGQA
jgi:hypothetical protein